MTARDRGRDQLARSALDPDAVEAPRSADDAIAGRLPFFYGWVIVGVSFVFVGLAYTVWYSFSVFLVALVADQGWGRGGTSAAFSIFVIVHGFAGWAAGLLVDRFGTRLVIVGGAVVTGLGLAACSAVEAAWQYYLAYGVVCAVGVSLVGWTPNVVIVQRWFERRLGLAIGIASAGIGAGILALVPATEWAIARLGWRAAYLVQAAVLVVVVIPLALIALRERPQDLGLHPDGARTASSGTRRKAVEPTDERVIDHTWAAQDWTPGKAARTRQFWLAALGFFSSNLAAQMVFVHQVALLVDSGRDRALAALVVGAIGLISVFGKIGWGILADRLGRELTFAIGTAGLMSGIALLALVPTVPGTAIVALFVVLFGLGYAVTPPLTPSVMADFFAGRSFGAIFGAFFVCTGFGSAAGAWTAGLIFDLTQSYLLALEVGVALAALSAVCIWLAAPRRIRLAPGIAARSHARASPDTVGLVDRLPNQVGEDHYR
ncbi:MAG: MFS transporter [Chloroflexi bacterium]|nr:MFS transporter [Chloroflexota bacterium]